jgi:hypothetical protein
MHFILKRKEGSKIDNTCRHIGGFEFASYSPMFKMQPTHNTPLRPKPTQPLCPHHAPHPSIILDVLDDHRSVEGGLKDTQVGMLMRTSLHQT